MKIRSFLGRAVACTAALCATTALGCGSSGGGTVCDVDFGTLAGTYSFTWTTHNARYLNSCFDNFDDPNPVDPSKVTNCTWDDSSEDQTATIELVITEDGDIANAKITKVTGDGVDEDATDLGVKCEMLEGAICDAPIRCNITGDTCSSFTTGDPDEWKYSCNCDDGGANDPASAACQTCKTSYDKYQSEQTEYCQKGRDGDYFEFTLHVKE